MTDRTPHPPWFSSLVIVLVAGFTGLAVSIGVATFTNFHSKSYTSAVSSTFDILIPERGKDAEIWRKAGLEYGQLLISRDFPTSSSTFQQHSIVVHQEISGSSSEDLEHELEVLKHRVQLLTETHGIFVYSHTTGDRAVLEVEEGPGRAILVFSSTFVLVVAIGLFVSVMSLPRSKGEAYPA